MLLMSRVPGRMLLDPTDNKPTRVGVRVDDSGNRLRYAKRTGKLKRVIS